MDVSVIIPTIPVPSRERTLLRAVESVLNQTVPVSAIIIEIDHNREGAAETRQRALSKVTTPWYLPLDDDDTLKPNAVELLQQTQRESHADYVYGHYDVIGGTDPRPNNLGTPFDPENPVQTTIVALARTGLSIIVGGYVDPKEDNELDSPDRLYAGEDWRLTKRYIDAGYHIVHCPHKVFDWYHHGKNTSGLPKNW